MNWIKYINNPVIGNEQTGTCFDAYIMKDDNLFRMYFSWRPKKSLAVCHSIDGINWGDFKIIMEPNPKTGFEDDINRNCVIRKDGQYLMWYTRQARGKSYIFYAVSDNGYEWKRYSDTPVIEPVYRWENQSVMNPCVIWDNEAEIFKMWYAAGETYEPNVIAYAESDDGIHWTKESEPVLVADVNHYYEKDRVGGCQVIKHNYWYVMFYIGYEDIDTARICMARSRDGKSNWIKHADNPIISPSEDSWDMDATYKPTVIYIPDSDKWYLYYNGRKTHDEYIGLAIHNGHNFW